MNTALLRAVVAAHASAAGALTPEGATPAVAASAPLIGATVVAPAPLGSAPVLRMLTPVVRVAYLEVIAYSRRHLTLLQQHRSNNKRGECRDML